MKWMFTPAVDFIHQTVYESIESSIITCFKHEILEPFEGLCNDSRGLRVTLVGNRGVARHSYRERQAEQQRQTT
jgi:hypothetical protein